MPEAMATEIERQCEAIEACYEFTLSYAARGLQSNDGNDAGRLLRDHLERAAGAMRGLDQSCRDLPEQVQLANAEKYEAFFEVLKHDAERAVAAVDLVLAQRAISSQLVDNLNASIHLRALLADLFLVTEILEAQQTQAKAEAANGNSSAR
jgi:hypothetical protein